MAPKLAGEARLAETLAAAAAENALIDARTLGPDEAIGAGAGTPRLGAAVVVDAKIVGTGSIGLIVSNRVDPRYGGGDETCVLVLSECVAATWIEVTAESVCCPGMGWVACAEWLLLLVETPGTVVIRGAAALRSCTLNGAAGCAGVETTLLELEFVTVEARATFAAVVEGVGTGAAGGCGENFEGETFASFDLLESSGDKLWKGFVDRGRNASEVMCVGDARLSWTVSGE
jgi:hypothetical protein